jgi:hypothetical protein
MFLHSLCGCYTCYSVGGFDHATIQSGVVNYLHLHIQTEYRMLIHTIIL